jgi:kynurenine formamidase
MVRPLAEIVEGLPSNWGRWGPQDEVGALNFLGAREVVRAAREIQTGRVFTLGVPLARLGGDPIWPGRPLAARYPLQDRGTYLAGHVEAPAGDEYADDVLFVSLHGTTHCDALGHVWMEDQLYNGSPAESTIDRLEISSILPIAQRGIVGRAVLVDIAACKGRPQLERGEPVTLEDVKDTIERQGCDVEPHDIVLLRTGWVGGFYSDPSDFNQRPLSEPGLLFSAELVSWFADLEIAALGTDTLGNELTIHPEHGEVALLHVSLMRNLGLVFNEVLWLDDLGTYCQEVGRYSSFYVGAPLKITGASGAPFNPVAIM